MTQHTAVRPARHTRFDTDLATNVRRVHGYQGYCACGWEGGSHRSRDVARAEADVHRRIEHRLPWEPVTDTPPAGRTD